MDERNGGAFAFNDEIGDVTGVTVTTSLVELLTAGLGASLA